MKRKIISLLLILSLLSINVATYSHSGRTDSNGGHKDNKNKSGLGSYHYHCGGHPAHLHKDGICPYKSTELSSTSTENGAVKSESNSTSIENVTVKSIQNKLIELGYDCGEVDGIMGNKTKAAIKAFQKDKGLVVDGIVGPITRKALGL